MDIVCHCFPIQSKFAIDLDFRKRTVRKGHEIRTSPDEYPAGRDEIQYWNSIRQSSQQWIGFQGIMEGQRGSRCYDWMKNL